MSKVLVLNSSALGGSSVSNQVVQDAVVELRARDPGLVVTVRDLGANPIPHLNSDSASALRGAAPANEATRSARRLPSRSPIHPIARLANTCVAIDTAVKCAIVTEPAAKRRIAKSA